MCGSKGVEVIGKVGLVFVIESGTERQKEGFIKTCKICIGDQQSKKNFRLHECATITHIGDGGI